MHQASGVRLPETDSLGLPSLSASESQVSKPEASPGLPQLTGICSAARGLSRCPAFVQHYDSHGEWPGSPADGPIPPGVTSPTLKVKAASVFLPSPHSPAQRATRPSILGKTNTHNHRNLKTRKPGQKVPELLGMEKLRCAGKERGRLGAQGGREGGVRCPERLCGSEANTLGALSQLTAD